jgi:hypothetical protein
MKIETKFDLGQKVYPISQKRKEEFVVCPSCGGVGTIIIQLTGVEITCPKCYGRRGSTEYRELEWYVHYDYASKIGKVDVERYNEYDKNHESRTAYMLEATGIGSGTIWYEEKLYPTLIEAQEECDKRNAKNPLL